MKSYFLIRIADETYILEDVILHQHNEAYECTKLALDSFGKMYRRNPDDIDCIIEIEHCYFKLGNIKNALIWNKKALILQPNNEDALVDEKKLKKL